MKSHRNFKDTPIPLSTDVTPILLWQSDNSALYTHFNPPWLNFTGRTLKQEKGNGWTKGIHPDDKQLCMATYLHAFNLQQTFTLEFRLQRTDKSYCWMQNIGLPQFNGKGTFVGYKGTCVDIDITKLATAALKESEIKLRLVADFSYDWEYCEGKNKEFIYISPSCEKISGYTINEYLTDVLLMEKIVHPDDRVLMDEHLLREHSTLSLSETAELNFRIIKKDGSIRHVLHSCAPVFDDHRNLVGRRVSNHDITDRKLFEDSMNASELRYRRLFESSMDGILMLDAITGKITDVNPTLIKMLGFTQAELFEKEIWEIGAFKDLAANHVKFLELQQKQFVRYEDLPIETKSGRTVNVEFVSNVYVENNRRVIQCNIRDITSRKRVEVALAKSESRYRELMNNLEAGVVFHAADTSILMSNPKAAELLGITANQMDGRLSIDPQWQFLTAGSTPMNIEDYPVNQIIRTKLPIKDFIIGINRPATKDTVWLLVNGLPVLDKQGEIEEVLISFIDLTEIKNAKEALEKITADLQTSNADLENFAYIASHDLQEPLRMVHSFLNLLERKLKDHLDDTTRQYIHFAIDGANRMKILINDLLQYSRIGSEKDELLPVDTTLVVSNVLHTLHQLIAENRASITTKDLPVVMANKTLINELFLNLIINALKYCKAKEPTVEVGCTETSDHYSFYVKDNGIGISPEYFDKIFIIFKRLHNKDEYSGTGIGLALCKKIVEIHKGKIWVESEMDKGSTFYFTIRK